MTNEQIRHMVDRFLGWELPKDFNPDNGISYAPYHRIHPSGTNLFTAAQAEAMVRYMVEDLPVAQRGHQERDLSRALTRATNPHD